MLGELFENCGGLFRRPSRIKAVCACGDNQGVVVVLGQKLKSLAKSVYLTLLHSGEIKPRENNQLAVCHHWCRHKRVDECVGGVGKGVKPYLVEKGEGRVGRNGRNGGIKGKLFHVVLFAVKKIPLRGLCFYLLAEIRFLYRQIHILLLSLCLYSNYNISSPRRQAKT
jgi:hypothetical protein